MVQRHLDEAEENENITAFLSAVPIPSSSYTYWENMKFQESWILPYITACRIYFWYGSLG